MVIDIMGEKFLERPPFNLESAYQGSNRFTPFVFVLSPGADPRQSLINLADRLNMRAQLVLMSLG